MMGAYYNEFDPFAAAWLRELIKDGLIADGEVDTRSIRDVVARDLAGFTQHHFFAGIGGWSYALRLAGWPDDRPVWTGSCPCQPFSAAGKRKGTADDRHLWPEFARLLSDGKPTVVFGEQVASKDGRLWLAGVRADLEALAYGVGAADLCAAGVGAPHIRQRLFWVAESEGKQPHGRGDARRGRGEFADGCVDSRLAESDDRRKGLESGSCNGLRARREESHAQSGSGRSSAVGERLGNTFSDDVGRLGRSSSGEKTESDRRRPQHGSSSVMPRSASAAGGLQHAARDGREQRRPEPDQRSSEPERTSCDGISDASSDGREQSAEMLRRRESFFTWSSADSIHCADRKARRVESGIFPLAHGIPNRVGTLRGAGNAIVPQVAAEFIQAYLVTLD